MPVEPHVQQDDLVQLVAFKILLALQSWDGDQGSIRDWAITVNAGDGPGWSFHTDRRHGRERASQWYSNVHLPNDQLHQAIDLALRWGQPVPSQQREEAFQ